MWKKALVLILLTSMLLVPFAKATSYNVNYGREIAFYSDVTLQNSKDLYATGFYYSATQGSTQESPTRFDDDSQSGFYVNHLYVQWEVGKALGYIYLEDSDDKTVYDDEKVAFALMEDVDETVWYVVNTSFYQGLRDPILAFWYLENPTIMTDYAYYHWYVDESADAYFDINDPPVLTYPITVTDQNGNQITEDVKIYLDLVADDSTGITSTNVGLFFNILKDYFDDLYIAGTQGSNLTIYPDPDGTTELKLPQYVYYGKEYDVVAKTYKFKLQAEYTASNGTTYTSDVVQLDTAQGSTLLTLTIPVDIGEGEPPAGEQYIYISFYYDESMQSPVYLPDYNISVIKAFSPDGLSSPATHTYELYNYYTLKIPVDNSYPYAVVTLKDGNGNIAFKKGYVMEEGTYTEVMTGTTFLVKIRVYNTANNSFLNTFRVELIGQTTSYTLSTTNGEISQLVVPDTYILEIYDASDNLIYSTSMKVDKNVDLTAYVNVDYVAMVELDFVDATLRPVYVGNVLERFNLYLTKSTGYFVDLERSTAFKYTLDDYFMNNKAYYYIYEQSELQEWQDGIYLSIYDGYTGTKLRDYRLVLTDNNRFLIVLPYSYSPTGEDAVDAPTTTIPMFTATPSINEYRQQMVTSTMDWFFKNGMLMVLVVVGVAFGVGDALGRGAGIYIGLALTMVFTFLGYIPKAIGLLSALGFSAILLKELNIGGLLPKGEGEK